MGREEIFQRIAENRDQIRDFGVRSIALFGSASRDDFRDDSDVDVLVELSHKSFDQYMDLKFFLQDLLGRKVDLVLRDTVKPALRTPILSSSISVPGF